MKNFSDILNGKYVYEIVLGKQNDGLYCCTNISEADVFLKMIPKLKEIYKTEVPMVLNQMYSNETSPIAIKFISIDEKTIALYNREKTKIHYVKVNPFADPTPIQTPVHNVLTIYDVSFCDTLYEISNKTLNIKKYIK